MSRETVVAFAVTVALFVVWLGAFAALAATDASSRARRSETRHASIHPEATPVELPCATGACWW